MSKFKKFMSKHSNKAGVAGLLIGGLLIATGVFAAVDPTKGLELSGVSSQISSTVGHMSVILSNIALIAGIAFVMASFFKFHQHKLNPTQVPLSQGVTLLLIGAGLTLLPLLVPTAKNTVFGPSATVSTLSGSNMSKLINNTGN
jgi:intracellular multiplication protein IcmD